MANISFALRHLSHRNKDFCTKRNMSNFFLSASILWPDQHVQKLYSISCYEIKFSSDLLSLVDLAKDQTIFVFYQSGDKQTNAFFPGPASFCPPLLPPYTLTISTTPNYLEDSSIAPWCKNCHPTTLPFFITSFIYILGNIRWCLKIALALCKCWVERWLMARRQ